MAGQARKAVAGAKALFTSADAPGLIYDTLAVNPKSLAQRKDDWAKVVKVWYRVSDFVRDPKTQPEAVAIMAAKVGVKPEEYAAALPGTYFLSLAEAKKRFEKGETLESLYGSTKMADEFNVANKVYKEGAAGRGLHLPGPCQRALGRRRAPVALAGRSGSPFPRGAAALLMVASFLLPLLLWSALSYVPFLWHPFVEITDPGGLAEYPPGHADRTRVPWRRRTSAPVPRASSQPRVTRPTRSICPPRTTWRARCTPPS